MLVVVKRYNYKHRSSHSEMESSTRSASSNFVGSSSTFNESVPTTSVPTFQVIRKIDPASLDTLRNVITTNLKHLVFRRVKQVCVKRENLIETVYTTYDNGKKISMIYKPGKEPQFTPAEYEHNVEERYSAFYFFTTGAAIRDNDRRGGVELFGASNKYSQLDLDKVMSFRFSYLKEDRRQQVPPRINDLICGLVEDDKFKGKKQHGGKNPSFKFWFTCSDQFLHAWTAIMYGEHETLEKLVTSDRVVDHEAEIRRKLMKGNKLCTNSFLKWQHANEDNGVVPHSDELKLRFYVLRTEQCAIDYVHVYAALVLIVRYRELPNESNVPTNIDGPAEKHLPMKKWDLPNGWLDRFVKRYRLVEVDEKHRIPLPRLPFENIAPKDGSAKGVAIPARKKGVVTPTPVNTPEDAPVRGLLDGEHNNVVIINSPQVITLGDFIMPDVFDSDEIADSVLRADTLDKSVEIKMDDLKDVRSPSDDPTLLVDAKRVDEPKVDHVTSVLSVTPLMPIPELMVVFAEESVNNISPIEIVAKVDTPLVAEVKVSPRKPKRSPVKRVANILPVQLDSDEYPSLPGDNGAVNYFPSGAWADFTDEPLVISQ